MDAVSESLGHCTVQRKVVPRGLRELGSYPRVAEVWNQDWLDGRVPPA